MNPARCAAPLRRAGVLPAKPCQPVEIHFHRLFFNSGPPRNVFRGLDGDIVLFRFNV